MINQDLKRKLTLYAKDPNLARFLEGQRVSQTVKGEKGDKGDSPIKGIDYFTPSEIQEIIQHVLRQATPIKGKHYFDGAKGEKGERGENGKNGMDGIDGQDGRNISPKEAKMILADLLKEVDLEKFATHKSVKDQFKEYGLSTSKSLEKRLNALQDAVMRNYGGHGGKSGGSSANSIFNEVVSGSGTSFTLANTPVSGSQALYALGQRLTLTVDYTISGANITLINSLLAGSLLADYQF